MSLLLLTAFIAIAISFLCSLIEACILSLSLTDIADISEKKPYIAQIWKGFKEKIQKPLAVILVINTFAYTIGAAVSGSQFGKLYGIQWVGLYSILFSLIMIQWTEVLPKTLGVRYNKFLANTIAVPLKIFIQVFTPLVVLLQFINRPFEGKRRVKTELDALQEITILARFAALNKLLSLEEERIVSRSINLSRIRVNEVMINRRDIKSLSSSMNLRKALIEAHIHHHTRFPLCRGENLNDIVGYINFKDIVSALQINPKNPSLEGIVRPVLAVKPSDNLAIILKKMTMEHQHIAIVKDNEGVTVGLVTLEDVIESIVGEIEDEYDILPTYTYKITEERYIVGGGIMVSQLREKLSRNFPDLSIPLNDWLYDLFKGNIEIEGKISFKGLLFIVRKMRRSKIYEAIVIIGDKA